VKAGRTYWIVATIILIWNLTGIVAYYIQASMDLTELAKTDAYQAQIFANMPRWAWLAYGIAVGAGLLGAIALLLRRKWATFGFAVSLAAVFIQFSYTFLGTDLLAVRGWTTALFPLLIIAMALFEIWFARQQNAKGVLR